MPKFSVKKPLTVFVAVLAILVLGVVAYLKMTPDLMPNMDFPYVVIVTTSPGASPETVEADITKPMEQSMATLNEIKHVTSSSQNSVSMVVLEFEQGVNMDSTGVDIQQKIATLQGGWDDTVGTPYVLKINPTMLPVAVAAVSSDKMDVAELSEFVDSTLSAKLEGITGVASVSVSGNDELAVGVNTVTITVKAKGSSTPETDTVRVTFYGTDGKAVSTYNVTSGSSIDSKKVSDAQSKADTKTGYTFKGWKIDNKGDLYTSAQVAKIAIKSDVEFYAQLEKSSSNTVNKAPWRVSLYIYKDTKVGSADKVIDISDGIADAGKNIP